MNLDIAHAEPLAAMLNQQIAHSGKTLHQIAAECGFPTPNVLSMIRKGQTKMPLTRIPALASCLGLDQRQLLEAALKEYQPDLWTMLESLYVPRSTGDPSEQISR